MYSSRVYAKNPVFEIVHEESVKVYHLHMYNGNIQQNSLGAESCVTEEFHISSRLSPAFFHPDAMCCTSSVISCIRRCSSVLCARRPLSHGRIFGTTDVWLEYSVLILTEYHHY